MSESPNTIPCPGCPGVLRLNEDTLRFAHEGPHSADCNWKSIEPFNFQVMVGYKKGMWHFNDEGEMEKPPTPPVSDAQLNNVINVDFKNKKRVE